MQPAVLIRLRPAGPWRYGPGDGGHDRLDTQYRSDRLYSALTLAMKQLGWMEEWLGATAGSPAPALAFTSLFPFQGATLFVKPPATLWPPPTGLLTTPSPVFLSKIRWNVAAFVPASLVETILLGQPVLADQWLPDPESSCLLRRDRLNPSPFRTVLRTGAAVDRLGASTASVHTSACVEFEPGSGLWTIACYRDEAARSDWAQRVAAAFRLLADGGFGGRRSIGWGQSEAPAFEEGGWPGLLLPKLARALAKGRPEAQSDSTETPQHWLLSLFAAAASEEVDWSGGEYRVVVRGGYVEGTAGNKKQVRMIAEGSVLTSLQDLVGAAVDVAPDGFPHPVYRSGFAVSLRLPNFAPAVPEVVETELDQILSELEVVAAQEESVRKLPSEEFPQEEDKAIEEPPSSDKSEEKASAPERAEQPPSPESPVEELGQAEAPPSGSPELPAEFETQQQSSPEAEPENGVEDLESIEDPDPAGGEGPDHGI